MRADTPRYARYKQLHPDTSRYARYKQICPDTSSYTNHVQICPDMSRYKTAEEGQDRTMLTRRVNWRKKLAPIRKNQEKQEDNKVMTFTVVQAPSRWDDSKPTLKTFKQHRAPAGDLNPFSKEGKRDQPGLAATSSRGEELEALSAVSPKNNNKLEDTSTL